jgi:NAD(P)-dependent dehydrogenase (short-subunit alcohol dehydrogenase family)
MKFENKVVVITGAAGGIGKETTKAFANEGAKIVLVGRNAKKLDNVMEELGLKDENSIVLTADVSKEEDVRSIFDKAIKKFGKIDVLFNNAGFEGVVAPLSDYPVDVFDEVIGINLRGTFLCMKYALRIMESQKQGVIINNSSVGGLRSAPTTSAYSSSKFAINGLTRTAAIEYALKNIRINAICPSPVETRMMRSLEAGSNTDPDIIKNALKGLIPMGRYAKPEEIAKIVLFLASDEASFVTGTTFPIDGGMLA